MSSYYTKTETNSYVAGEIAGAILDLDKETVGGSTKYITTISEANGIIDATAETSDTVPTAGSDKLVRSQGIKTYVDTAETNAKSDWFKLGTQITAATLHANNLNNYKTPGHYYIASNTAATNTDNTPVNYAGKLDVELISNAENYIRQTYFSNTDSTGLICVRRYKGVDAETQQDIWSEWQIFATQANIIPMTYGVDSATIIGASGYDCDTALTPGVYLAQNTTYAENAKGRPAYANSGAKIWRMEVKLLNASRVYQEMIVYRIGTYEGDFDRYQRIRHTNGTWNDWQHIETTAAGTYYPSAQSNVSNSLMNTGFNAELTVEPDEDEPQDER